MRIRTYRPLTIGALAATLVATVALRPGNAQEKFTHGQTIAPAYEGFIENPDGTFDLVFGYLNRNYEELLDVPIQVWSESGWTVDPTTVRIVMEGPSASLGAIAPQDVVAFVHLPDDPNRASYDVPWGPEEGMRLRILHPGGDEVRVASVTPSRVKVTRQ